MRLQAVPETDEDLMRVLRETCDAQTAERVFGEVFARYHERVIAWCYRIAKNRDDAHDLAQEVFLKAYRHRQSFRGEARLSTWLYAITRNHCLTAAARKECEVVPLDALPGMAFRDRSAIPADTAAERHQMAGRMLGLMVRVLEPMEAQVMALHYAHDVPLAAITRDLGLENPSGAKAYIVNGRRKLFGLLRRRGMRARTTCFT